MVPDSVYGKYHLGEMMVTGDEYGLLVTIFDVNGEKVHYSFSSKDGFEILSAS